MKIHTSVNSILVQKIPTEKIFISEATVIKNNPILGKRYKLAFINSLVRICIVHILLTKDCKNLIFCNRSRFYDTGQKASRSEPTLFRNALPQTAAALLDTGFLFHHFRISKPACHLLSL